MPTELATLTDARGKPIGEWAAEPMPGAQGRWVHLIVLRAKEWSPAVRGGQEEEVARAVAALDLELALFPAASAVRARGAGARCGSWWTGAPCSSRTRSRPRCCRHSAGDRPRR